jgi:hypothetical protein
MPSYLALYHCQSPAGTRSLDYLRCGLRRARRPLCSDRASRTCGSN